MGPNSLGLLIGPEDARHLMNEKDTTKSLEL